MSTPAFIVVMLLFYNFLSIVRTIHRGYTGGSAVRSIIYYFTLGTCLLVGGAFSAGSWTGYFLAAWIVLGILNSILAIDKDITTMRVDFASSVFTILIFVLQVHVIWSMGFFLPA